MANVAAGICMQILARMPSQEIEVENRRVPRLRGIETPPGRTQRIFDISRFGCQIESCALSDGCNGQFVEIDFGTIVIRAIIRWSEGTRLGLEFTRPLGSADVDALLADPIPIRLRRL